MTANSDAKKYLSLSDVRIYHNKKTDTFEITGKSSEIENGFLMNVPHDNKMEEKLRKAFGVNQYFQPSKTKKRPLMESYISYHPDLEEIDRVVLEKKFFQNILPRISPVPSFEGKVIAVASDGVNVGKTTVSTMLASYASLIASSATEPNQPLKICIVETGWSDNKLSHLLFPHKKDKTTVLNLFLEEELTTESLIKHLVYDDGLGIHTLLGAVRKIDQRYISPIFYKKVISLLKGMFDLVILDVSDQQQDEEAKLWEMIFENADKTLLVTDLEPASLEGMEGWVNTARNGEAFGGYSVDPSKINIVVNKNTVDKNIVIAGLANRTGTASIAGILPWDESLERYFSDNVSPQQLVESSNVNTDYLALTRNVLESLNILVSPDSENREKMKPRFYMNGSLLQKNFPDVINIGTSVDNDFVQVDLKNKQNGSVLITGRKSQGSMDIIENMRQFMDTSKDTYEIFTYGLTAEFNAELYPQEQQVADDLDLLRLLRKLKDDISEGITFVNPKIVILGNMDKIVYEERQDASRVDKAVRAELLELVRDLAEDKSPNIVNFIFVSESPSSAYNSLASVCKTHVHCGVKNESLKVRDFIDKNVPADLSDFFDDVKGRAVIRTPKEIRHIQIFEPLDYPGGKYVTDL